MDRRTFLAQGAVIAIAMLMSDTRGALATAPAPVGLDRTRTTTARAAGILNDDHAALRLEEIRAGLADTLFAWSGPLSHDPGHNGASYFRVHGSGLFIEFSPEEPVGDLTMHAHTIYLDQSNAGGRASHDGPSGYPHGRGMRPNRPQRSNMNPTLTNRVSDPATIPARPIARSSPAMLQRRLRDIHTYLGMLFAPSLVFFAMTGALQLYNLHEVRPNRSFEPPALLQELGMVHKDQVFRMPRRHAPPEQPGGAPAPSPSPTAPSGAGDTRPHAEWTTSVLKAFFLCASLGLTASTCLGTWLGLRSGRNRKLSVGLLVAGVVVPALLLAL